MSGRSRPRVPLLIGATLVAVTAAALAGMFANAYGSSRTTERAAALHSAESALGAVTTTQGLWGQAVLYAANAEAGVSLPEDAAQARVDFENAVSAALGRVDRLLDGLTEPDGEIESAARRLEQTAAEASDVLAAQGAEAANGPASAELAASYQELIDALATRRNELGAGIVTAGTAATRAATASRFLVAFLVPAVALVGYWDWVRRQRRSDELAARLEAEQELGRAKDEFIANLSHELRTPLTGIHGFGLALQEQGFDDPDIATEMVDLIVRESTELSRMVDDLLTVAKADAGVLAFRVDDVKVLDEIGELLATVNHTGPPVTVHCPPAVVRADGARLRQALRNLVSNARRHGGPAVQIHGEHVPGGWFDVAVVDDGPGVPPEMEGRLFERFTHTGDQPLLEGSVGLGLNIVQVLADGMGATVRYERPGSETRFVIRLRSADSDHQI